MKASDFQNYTLEWKRLSQICSPRKVFIRFFIYQSVWLGQLVKSLATATHVHSWVQEIWVQSSDQAISTQDSIPSGPVQWGLTNILTQQRLKEHSHKNIHMFFLSHSAWNDEKFISNTLHRKICIYIKASFEWIICKYLTVTHYIIYMFFFYSIL